MKRRLLGMLSSAALLAGMLLAGLVAPVSATDGGTFPWGGQGWPNQSCNTNPTSMLWIFTGKGANLDNVVLHWDTGQSVPMTNQGNGAGSYHAFTPFFVPPQPPDGTIYVTYTGTLEGNATLTISGCNEEGGGPGTSGITTTVHAGQTDTGNPVEVTNDAPAAVESYVHDSGSLTFSVAALPAGSHVTFYFFTNNTCTVPASDSADIDVSGATSPDVLDPELAEQVLAAQGYSYQAFFYSGDSGIVQDAAGDCEPFSASVQAQTSTISTTIHVGGTDADPQNPTVAGLTVVLGTTVHG